MALSKTVKSLIELLAKSIAAELKQKSGEQNTKKRSVTIKRKP